MEASWKERLDKLVSREFLGSVAFLVIISLALFLLKTADGNPAVAFNDFCFWGTIAVGIGPAAVTIQKVGGALLKRGE